MTGPDVTVQLAYDEAVIRTEHQILVRPLGPMGRKKFTSAIEHCVNR
jgi:hypothetical protein